MVFSPAGFVLTVLRRMKYTQQLSLKKIHHGLKEPHTVLSVFLSWVAKTQLNHWTVTMT